MKATADEIDVATKKRPATYEFALNLVQKNFRKSLICLIHPQPNSRAAEGRISCLVIRQRTEDD